jgi:hypothetical protein
VGSFKITSRVAIFLKIKTQKHFFFSSFSGHDEQKQQTVHGACREGEKSTSTLTNQCFYGHLNFMFFVIKILKSTEEKFIQEYHKFRGSYKSIPPA